MMNKFVFGEIVLLKFPFTDGDKSKKRPALILLDSNDGDIVVCRITSKLYNSDYDFRIENWEKVGLKLPSVIRLHKIATLDKLLIEQIIGIIDAELKMIVKSQFDRIIF